MFRSTHLAIVSLCGRSVYRRCVTYLESSIARNSPSRLKTDASQRYNRTIALSNLEFTNYLLYNGEKPWRQ
ncbi:hypothetical protein QUA71_16670 [Microcoleus sp. MON1_C5]|uniref:hypothetical protein n=1 Tax=Microcoleus sp. MON1_C5 TaxID=2818828 RepID=UPI002FCFB119